MQMMTRIYAADHNRRYAIAESKGVSVVLRHVPCDEYWDYYRKRRDEIWIDEGGYYWLYLRCKASRAEAELFLKGIGVDTQRQEANPRKKGEGQFFRADYHMRIVTCM